jgi:hypothetical protein
MTTRIPGTTRPFPVRLRAVTPTRHNPPGPQQPIPHPPLTSGNPYALMRSRTLQAPCDPGIPQARRGGPCGAADRNLTIAMGRNSPSQDMPPIGRRPSTGRCSCRGRARLQRPADAGDGGPGLSARWSRGPDLRARSRPRRDPGPRRARAGSANLRATIRRRRLKLRCGAAGAPARWPGPIRRRS